MTVFWKGVQATLILFLIAGLLFASGVFGALLYAKITGKTWWEDPTLTGLVVYAEKTAGIRKSDPLSEKGADSTAAKPAKESETKPKSVMIEVPIIRQLPELPSGCEITSLAMLLNFYGLDKSKMELASEMRKDSTPIRYNPDDSIAYWGNPNLGFVGEINGSAKGFGIYHTALYDLLKQYVPTAIDVTREPFSKLEEHLVSGIPAVVWTTIDYQVPDNWVIWDTPIGPIQTTFMEHAVLLVGFDEEFVYVNDPLSGKSKQKIDKNQFIETWEAMGRQALTYK